MAAQPRIRRLSRSARLRSGFRQRISHPVRSRPVVTYTSSRFRPKHLSAIRRPVSKPRSTSPIISKSIFKPTIHKPGIRQGSKSVFSHRRWHQPRHVRWRKHRKPWSDWRYRPSRIYVSTVSGYPATRPSYPVAPPGIRPAAWLALLRRGMGTPIWHARLTGARKQLVDFINRFYRSDGFDLIVRAAFGNRYHRAIARFYLAASARLVGKHQDPQRLSFEPGLAYLPGGTPVRSIRMLLNGRYHLFFPFSHLDKQTILSQFTHDQALYNRSRSVRWVFSRKIGLSPAELRGRIRQILAATGRGNLAWLERLSDWVRMAS